jgi:hypothetical protein
MSDNFNSIKALEKKSRYFSRWLSVDTSDRSVDIETVDSKCPDCASDVICAYADMGLTDSYHTFAHVCLNPQCNYCEEGDRFESNIGGGPGSSTPTLCIFCSRGV